MKYIIFILFLMLSHLTYSQVNEFVLQNIKGEKKYFAYGNDMIIKLKDGKEAAYPQISFYSNKEKIITLKLVFHSLDSFYYKDKFAIAFNDIEWFYQRDFFSYTTKILAIEFILSGFLIATFTKPSGYYLLSFPIILMAFPLTRKLEKGVFYTNEWKTLIPERKNFYYKYLDKNPSLIFSK